MKKTKWYKDKWGWIGGLTGLLTGFFDFLDAGHGLMKASCSGGLGQHTCTSVVTYGLNSETWFWVYILGGFIIGLGIHKLFIKLKWVRR